MVYQNLTDDDPNREMINSIQRAGEQAVNLTSQLLAFSRKQAFQSRIVNCNVLLRGVYKLLKCFIGENIKLSLTAEASPGLVSIDPGQFELAIINLCVNARDAMPKGGKLALETHNVNFNQHASPGTPQRSPGAFVLITVTDTGFGMDPATRERIFEPFFTTKEAGKGTGLGLAMVYWFVVQSGGRIEVTSDVGKGTSFRIFLPAVTTDSSQPVQSYAITGGTETVLVVEDNEPLRGLVKMVLESNGYRVLTACDGNEALALVAGLSEPLHLLLTDLVMPGMSGKHLADILIGKLPMLRVVFMSGHPDEAVEVHGIGAKAAFLKKPFNPVGLARMIRETLDEKTPDL
jgi:CheY-like chemotaxis protein